MTWVIIVSLLSFNLTNQHLNLCITWDHEAQSLNTKRPLDLSRAALNLALNRPRSSSEVPISFHVIPPPRATPGTVTIQRWTGRTITRSFIRCLRRRQIQILYHGGRFRKSNCWLLGHDGFRALSLTSKPLNELADTFRHHYVEINPLHRYPWREFLHIVVLIPNVASDVKNIILWSSRYPHFRESYGTDVDYTRIPFSSLSPMSQKTFITAAQKANVSEGYEGLDVALRNDNLSAWVALVLSRMTRIETLHLSIPSE
jgi:hypothetical protein